MLLPRELLYTESHLWLLTEEGTATVGITQFLAETLREVSCIDLAEPDTEVSMEGHLGDLEGLDSDAELFSPVEGVVTDINEDVLADTSLLTSDPYGDGWLLKLQVSEPEELGYLLTAREYENLLSPLE